MKHIFVDTKHVEDIRRVAKRLGFNPTDLLKKLIEEKLPLLESEIFNKTKQAQLLSREYRIKVLLDLGVKPSVLAKNLGISRQRLWVIKKKLEKITEVN